MGEQAVYDAGAPLAVVSPSLISLLSGKRVLVIGDLMLDAYLIGDADRISPEAPVPVVRVLQERQLLGGAGNVARNIVALGGKATLIGTVGSDAAGTAICALLKEEGIESIVHVVSGRPSTVKTRIIARRQQMLRLDTEDTTPFEENTVQVLLDLVAQHLAEHEVIILSDYSKGIVSVDFMNGLRQLLSNHPKVRVLVDPKPNNMPLYKGAFMMTPNTKETGECAGLPVGTSEQILQAGRRILQELGSPYLLTTLGAEGMALFIGEEMVWHIPTTDQDVFDVTGAGDTVIATLGLALAAGIDVLSACMLANHAAGIVVAQVGSATASPEALADSLTTLSPPRLTRWA